MILGSVGLWGLCLGLTGKNERLDKDGRGWCLIGFGCV